MRYFSLIAFITLILTACSSPQNGDADNDMAHIAQLEKQLFDTEQGKPDREKALELVGLYVAYADDYPNDTISPELLYKASDISMNMGQPVKTIEIFDRLLNQYPNFEKTSTVLFLKAFVYEDQLREMEQARNYYELYLERYPNSEFADDAEVSLKNLGKTPEELIREFEASGQ